MTATKPVRNDLSPFEDEAELRDACDQVLNWLDYDCGLQGKLGMRLVRRIIATATNTRNNQ